MSLIQAAKDALEALDTYPFDDAHWKLTAQPAAEALRAALAEAEKAQPPAAAQPVAELVAVELERLANDPPISGNTLAQARVLMTAANVREFGLEGGAVVPPAQPVTVPAGWKLVPEVPTQEMCQQGQWKAQEWPKFPLRISPIYKAMLAAAPAAPAREPLSDAEILKMWEAHRAALPRYLCFARAIERAVRGEA